MKLAPVKTGPKWQRQEMNMKKDEPMNMENEEIPTNSNFNVNLPQPKQFINTKVISFDEAERIDQFLKQKKILKQQQQLNLQNQMRAMNRTWGPGAQGPKSSRGFSQKVSEHTDGLWPGNGEPNDVIQDSSDLTNEDPPQQIKSRGKEKATKFQQAIYEKLGISDDMSATGKHITSPIYSVKQSPKGAAAAGAKERDIDPKNGPALLSEHFPSILASRARAPENENKEVKYSCQKKRAAENIQRNIKLRQLDVLNYQGRLDKKLLEGLDMPKILQKFSKNMPHDANKPQGPAKPNNQITRSIKLPLKQSEPIDEISPKSRLSYLILQSQQLTRDAKRKEVEALERSEAQRRLKLNAQSKDADYLQSLSDRTPAGATPIRPDSSKIRNDSSLTAALAKHGTETGHSHPTDTVEAAKPFSRNQWGKFNHLPSTLSSLHKTHSGLTATRNRFQNKRNTWATMKEIEQQTTSRKREIDQENIKDTTSARFNFDHSYWKVHTDKILDNNNKGIGSILKIPTMGRGNLRKPKQSTSIERGGDLEDSQIKIDDHHGDKVQGQNFLEKRGQLAGFTSGTYLGRKGGPEHDRASDRGEVDMAAARHSHSVNYVEKGQQAEMIAPMGYSQQDIGIMNNEKIVNTIHPHAKYNKQTTIPQQNLQYFGHQSDQSQDGIAASRPPLEAYQSKPHQDHQKPNPLSPFQIVAGPNRFSAISVAELSNKATPRDDRVLPQAENKNNDNYFSTVSQDNTSDYGDSNSQAGSARLYDQSYQEHYAKSKQGTSQQSQELASGFSHHNAKSSNSQMSSTSPMRKESIEIGNANQFLAIDNGHDYNTGESHLMMEQGAPLDQISSDLKGQATLEHEDEGTQGPPSRLSAGESKFHAEDFMAMGNSPRVLTKISDHPELSNLKFLTLYNTANSFSRKLSLSNKVSPLTLPSNLEAIRNPNHQRSPRTLREGQLNGQGRPLPLRGGGGSLPNGPTVITNQLNQTSRTPFESVSTIGQGSTEQKGAAIYAELLNQYKSRLSVDEQDLMQSGEQMLSTFQKTANDFSPFNQTLQQNQSLNQSKYNWGCGSQYPSMRNTSQRLSNLQICNLQMEQRERHRIGKGGDLYQKFFERNQGIYQIPFESKAQKLQWVDAMENLYHHQSAEIQALSNQQVGSQEAKLLEFCKDKTPIKRTFLPKSYRKRDYITRIKSNPLEQSPKKGQSILKSPTHANSKREIEKHSQPVVIVNEGAGSGQPGDDSAREDKSGLVKQKKKRGPPVDEVDPRVAMLRAKRTTSELPGQQELDLIHKADLGKMTAEEIAQVIGTLSWKLNPLNEIQLYETLREAPLFEVLQRGMSTEERHEQITLNTQPKKKKASRVPTFSVNTPAASASPLKIATDLTNSNQASGIQIVDAQPVSPGVPVATSSQTSAALLTEGPVAKADPTLEGSGSAGAPGSPKAAKRQGAGPPHSTLTFLQLYEQNPLTALDLSHLAPSLRLKLMAEPNTLLINDEMREEYLNRMEDSVATAKDTADKRNKVWAIELVDQILGRSGSGSQNRPTAADESREQQLQQKRRVRAFAKQLVQDRRQGRDTSLKQLRKQFGAAAQEHAKGGDQTLILDED